MYYLCITLIEAPDDKPEDGNNEEYTRRKRLNRTNEKL